MIVVIFLIVKIKHRHILNPETTPESPIQDSHVWGFHFKKF